MNGVIPCVLQAPSNMKSVLQAGWLFTVAVGNIIVLIISEAATLEDQVHVVVVVVVCFVKALLATPLQTSYNCHSGLQVKIKTAKLPMTVFDLASF